MMFLKTIQPVDLSPSEMEQAVPLGWNPVCHITYTRDTWVKLLQAPSEYAFNEAKLLCLESSNTWSVWIPDHGEVVLDRSHFYC